MAQASLEPIQIYGTVSLSATAASARVSLANAGDTNNLEISNAGPNDVFVKLGDGSVTASVPSGATSGGYPIFVGQTKTVRRNGESNLAAITSTGTATVYVSVGDGQ